MNTLNIYVGHDPREQVAFDLCKYSIERRSRLGNVNVHKLSSADIPEFNRPREAHQATDFTYTRFLVPFLNNYKGWAMFVDCDFLFLQSPENIILENPKLLNYPVSVCKHPQYTPNSDIKMDGISQAAMWRKNWCSLILFNCEHPANRVLTTDMVNTHNPGRDFHQLKWLNDNQIGSIPLNWNCLDDYYHLDNPKAIHYTDGGPWFDNYKNTMYSEYWINEYNLMVNDVTI